MEFVQQSALAILYWASLFLPGLLLAVLCLRVRDAAQLAVVTLLFGPASYITATNLLGYVMPITAAFSLLCFLSLASSSAITLLWRRELTERLRGVETPPWGIALPWILLALLAGLAQARYEGSDALFPLHLPIPATILAGNFPMREMMNPDLPLGYHYGAGLFAASLSHVSGMHLMSAYAFQPFFAVAGILLTGASLAWRLRRSWGWVFLGSILLLGGGGLFWLNGFSVLADLWKHFALQDMSITNPLRALSLSIAANHANPLFAAVAHRPMALGFIFFFGLLCVLHEVLFADRGRLRAGWFTFGIVLGTALAHTMETSLVLLCVALAAFVPVYCLDRWRAGDPRPWDAVLTLIALFAPMLLIAFVQGGVLTGVLRGGDHTSVGSFAFWFDGRIHHEFGPVPLSIALWSLAFVRDYGLPILALPVIVFYAWKRRSAVPLLFLLSTVAVTHFVFPLFVHYVPNEQDFLRMFFPAIGIGAFLLGFLLWEGWLHSPLRSRRLIALIMVAAMLAGSAAHMAVRLAFPSLTFAASPLFPRMPEISDERRALYEWVASHTTLEDRFFMHAVDENPGMQLERTLFLTYARRFLISRWYRDSALARSDLLLTLRDRCDMDALRGMRITHLVQTLPSHEEWFVRTCDPKHWRLVYGEAARLPRVLVPR